MQDLGEFHTWLVPQCHQVPEHGEEEGGGGKGMKTEREREEGINKYEARARTKEKQLLTRLKRGERNMTF